MRGCAWISTDRKKAVAWLVLITLAAAWTVSGAPAEPSDGRAALRRELDAIADLLIDGRHAEGLERANQLLAGQEELSRDILDRAQALADKAAAKLAESAPPDSPSPHALSFSSEAPSPAETWLRSYRVKVALVGVGFSQGDLGLLRIGRDRLLFIPWNRGGRQWSLAWADLARATEADGLWDAPYPIELVESDGTEHYLSRVDNSDGYMAADSMLAAILEARANTRRQP